MNRYYEIKKGNTIDRYLLEGISDEDFKRIKQLKPDITFIPISQEDFEDHINYPMQVIINVENKFKAIHYIAQFESAESEREWLEFLAFTRTNPRQ
jgi:hypothetical protein